MNVGFLGAAKDAPIVTPLMDFVRQKRAAKGGSRVGTDIITLYTIKRFLSIKLCGQFGKLQYLILFLDSPIL